MIASFCRAVPSTPGPDVVNCLTSPRPQTDVTTSEAKMAPSEVTKTLNDVKATSVSMLRRALDGDVAKDMAEREAFIQQFVKLQISQEEKILQLEKTNHQLRIVSYKVFVLLVLVSC